MQWIRPFLGQGSLPGQRPRGESNEQTGFFGGLPVFLTKHTDVLLKECLPEHELLDIHCLDHSFIYATL